MAKRTPLHPTIAPEIIGPTELAAMLGCRREKVYKLAREGKLPATVRLDEGPKKWRSREVLDWIDAGLPDPDAWDWRPTVRLNLEQLIDQLKRQALALGEEIVAKKKELESLTP